MPRDDLIAWLDLETTGSDINHHVLIETGIILTTATPKLEIVREYSKVHRPAYWSLYRERMAPVVVDMHTKNKLIEEINGMENREYAYKQYEEQEEEILEFLGKGTEHIPLAGSGVCHFDRQYIRRFLPRVDERFTYWSYDIGVVRRMIQLAGNQPPTTQEGKTHRALDDVRGAIEDARRYLRFFAGWGVFEEIEKGMELVWNLPNSKNNRIVMP